MVVLELIGYLWWRIRHLGPGSCPDCPIPYIIDEEVFHG